MPPEHVARRRSRRRRASHPVASACSTNVVSSSRKSRAPATIRSWSRSVPAPGCDRADRRVPGADVGADDADHDEQRRRPRPSRGSRPGRRARRGSPGARRAADQDRERQDRHPPGHQPGALVVGRRSSRPASRRRAPGRRRTPSRRPGTAPAPTRRPAPVEPRSGAAKSSAKHSGERRARRGAGTAAAGRAGRTVRSLIRPATGLSTTSHAFGQEHDQRRRASGRDAEGVGEVGQQHQPGHGAERAGRHRAEP